MAHSFRDTSPPDFTSGMGFGVRRSVLIQPENLLILSHTYQKDRIERVNYDRIDHTILRLSFPLLRLILWGLFWGLPAFFLTLGMAVSTHTRDNGFMIIPLAFTLLPLSVCIVRAILMRKVEITVVRGGTPRVIKLYALKKKSLRAYEKLTLAIQTEQARLNGITTA